MTTRDICLSAPPEAINNVEERVERTNDFIVFNISVNFPLNKIAYFKEEKNHERRNFKELKFYLKF